MEYADGRGEMVEGATRGVGVGLESGKYLKYSNLILMEAKIDPDNGG